MIQSKTVHEHCIYTMCWLKTLFYNDHDCTIANIITQFHHSENMLQWAIRATPYSVHSFCLFIIDIFSIMFFIYFPITSDECDS